MRYIGALTNSNLSSRAAALARLSGTLLLALTLVSCTTLQQHSDELAPPSGDVEHAATADTQTPVKQSPPPTRAFPADSLLDLLVGELAVYEADLGAAARLYSNQAHATRDTGVAQRAALLTRHARDRDGAFAMAALWYELQPRDDAAVENYADMLARFGRHMEAIDILKQRFHESGKGNFSVLRSSSLSPSQLPLVLGELETLNAVAHNNQSLRFTYALLLQQAGQSEKALAQVDALRDDANNEDEEKIARLEASLLTQLNQPQKAAAILAEALANDPDNKNLRAEYARLLTKFDTTAAQLEFETLLAQHPRDIKLLMAHALSAADAGNFDASEESLKKLLQMHRRKDFAHYNLGRIALERKQPDTALGHLLQVQMGTYFAASTKLVLEIHQEQGKPDAALAHLNELRQQFPQQAVTFWAFESGFHRDNDNLEAALGTLDRAIAELPEENMLRMERSFVAEQLGNMNEAERDLLWILEREPNNASALNALGYMLTVNTKRYNDALTLIEKAIAIEPDDAAIRDSLGWVYFKLGRHQEAQRELEHAYAEMPDEEVAAHLIELYWTTDQKKQARKLYKTIKRNNKAHPKVEAIARELSISN